MFVVLTSEIFKETPGAAFLAHTADTLLLGVTSAQCIWYFRTNGRRDDRAFRFLVSPSQSHCYRRRPIHAAQIAFLWFLQATHLFVFTHKFYNHILSATHTETIYAVFDRAWYVLLFVHRADYSRVPGARPAWPSASYASSTVNAPKARRRAWQRKPLMFDLSGCRPIYQDLGQ